MQELFSVNSITPQINVTWRGATFIVVTIRTSYVLFL